MAEVASSTTRAGGPMAKTTIPMTDAEGLVAEATILAIDVRG